MDSTTAYCQTRRHLEEQTWVLTSQHAALTTRLHFLIGSDHDEFLTTLDQCQTSSLEVADSRDLLREHRREHGC
jgi:hypothetical protein